MEFVCCFEKKSSAAVLTAPTPAKSVMTRWSVKKRGLSRLTINAAVFGTIRSNESPPGQNRRCLTNFKSKISSCKNSRDTEVSREFLILKEPRLAGPKGLLQIKILETGVVSAD